MIQKEPVNKEAAAIVPEQIEQLRDLFPQAFTEGKIDFDKLKESLGEEVNSRPERYSFTWAGKRDAIRLLQTASRATLVPAKKESINFDETNNIFIEGDNLEVLKLLYKSYFGRVKMIYIDPPYNTGNDFVYSDNFTDPLDTYLKLTGQKTSEGNLLTSNPETSGRYHSAWLSMMYPRLFVARQLLRDDGVIFVSIDDNEVHNLRMVMNEIFGEENFVANIIWQKAYSPRNNAPTFSESHEFVICYARGKEYAQILRLPASEEQLGRYTNRDNDPRGDWKPGDLTVSLASGQRGRTYQKTGKGANLYELVSPSGKKFNSPAGRCWVYSLEKMEALNSDKRIWWGENGSNMPALKRFLNEIEGGQVCQTIWTYQEVGHNQEANKELKDLFGEKQDVVFATPKPVRLIRRMLQLVSDKIDNDIILDFFAGSCTTAQAVTEQNHEDGGNRRFIMVQLPEPTGNKDYPTIAEIGKERIRRVVAKMEKEKDGKLELKNGNGAEDLAFKVFNLAESNYKPWTGPDKKDPAAYADQMALYMDPFVPGWKPENVIWEVVIKEGYGLNSEIIHMKGITENAVYHVTDPDKGQSFRICLDEVLKPAAIRALALGKNDLFICRDKAMTDELVANLALQCRLKTI